MRLIFSNVNYSMNYLDLCTGEQKPLPAVQTWEFRAFILECIWYVDIDMTDYNNKTKKDIKLIHKL